MSEVLSGCLVTKHAWKGKYKRIMTITETHITTYNPTTFETTNSWAYESIVNAKFNPKSGISSKEFTVTVKIEKSNNVKNFVFSTEDYEVLLTSILRNRRLFNSYKQNEEKKYNALKYNSNETTSAIYLVIGSAGIEQFNFHSRKMIGIYFYKDIEKLITIKAIDSSLVIQHKIHNRLRFFVVQQTADVIKSIKNMAFFYIGVDIKVEENSISQEFYLNNRLGIYSNDECLKSFIQFKVNKVSPRSQQLVSRLFSLGEECIIEHDPATYRIITVKPFNQISMIIRYEDVPQKFNIIYKQSGLQSGTNYFSSERDTLLATLIDVIRINGDFNIHISSQTNSIHRCTLLNKPIEIEIELLHLRILSEHEDKIDAIRRFNSNIPYSGLSHYNEVVDSFLGLENKQKIIINALNNLILMEKVQSLQNEDLENYFQCLRRLFATKTGFEIFTNNSQYLKALGSNVVHALSSNSDGVVYAAIEMINSLVRPMHANYDLTYETDNKLSIYSSKKFIKSLVFVLQNHILRNSGALVISALLDFFTYGICLPYSETTNGSQFQTLIKIFMSLGRSLFKLFNHPAGSIVKSTGMLMQALISEAGEEDVKNLQENALLEGVFPKHFLMALYVEPNDTRQFISRQLSRKLLALWLHKSYFAINFLKSILPLGFIIILESNEKAENESMHLSSFRNTLNVAIANSKDIMDPKLRVLIEKTERFLSHWQFRAFNRLSIEKTKNNKVKKIVALRNPKIHEDFEYNWDFFYQEFFKDHYKPDLIWNHNTREELKECIESEIRSFSVDKDLCVEKTVSWNYEEFIITYVSLSNQIKIGDYYIKPLLENNKINMITEPSAFFNLLYHTFVQIKDLELKLLCLRALEKVYFDYHEDIGEFVDMKHILSLLYNTNNKVLRDRLLLFINSLVKIRKNIVTFIGSKGLVQLVELSTLSHLHINKASIPLQTNLLEGILTEDSLKEWYYVLDDKDGTKKSEAISFAEVKSMYLDKVIHEDTKFWTSGMEAWKKLKEIVQLKWHCVSPRLFPDQILFNETDLAILCLDILIKMCSEFPTLDKDGGVIRPLPRIKRFLSDIRCLPHICQLALTFEPRIVERVCILLYEVMQENSILSQLFITGFFFFVMMYTGSNILPLARFLKFSHTKQSFHYKKNKNVKNNSIAQISILNPMFPESMICFLNNYEIEKFSEIFLGNFESPEVIWSDSMRKHMIEKIAVHLGNFSSKLKGNIKGLYMYCPMPPIEFEELKGELFCGNYYLKHLCNEDKYPNFEIKEPLKVLRDILEAWKIEVNKTPSKVTLEEAFKSLELDPNEKHEHSSVKKSYFKLANKYHPDKNPEGREIFEQVVKSYEFLCSRELLESEPSIENIILILKAQSILFKRCTSILKPYKYSGYTLLIQTIKTELQDDNVFSISFENSVLLPAVELCHYTIGCSVLNAEELRRENGMEILKLAMDKSVSMMGSFSKPEDFATQVCMHVVQSFTASALFDAFRTIVFELPGYVQNMCNMLFLNKNLPELVSKVVECVIALSGDEMVQIRLLQMGVFYHLILFLFNYDYTIYDSGIKSDAESNMQLRYNELAGLSLQALSIVSGTSLEFGSVNIACHTLLSNLLTPYVLYKLSKSSTMEVLKSLNINTESPYFIWNNETRKQLIELVEELRIPNSDNERENYEKACSFVYKEYKDLLYIGKIYVVYYNKYPDFKLHNSKEFIQELGIFVRDSINYFTTYFSMNEKTEGFDKKYTDILDILLAIKNLLTYYPEHEIFLNEHWSVIFLFCGFYQKPELQQITFKIISLSTRNNECVIAIEKANILGCIIQLLSVFTGAVLMELLECLDTLFSNFKLVKEGLQKGVLIYLLDIFCSNKDEYIRGKTCSLFAKLISDKLSGSRIRIILLKFLPTIFLDAVMDDISAAVVMFENNQENPELIWNDELRNLTMQSCRTLRDEFFAQQVKDHLVSWKISDDFSVFSHQLIEKYGDSIVISGVYVELLIKQPGWVLRRGKEFLIDIIDFIFAQYEQVSEKNTGKIETCTTCLNNLLHVQPHMGEILPQLGLLPKYIDCLENVMQENLDQSRIIIGSIIKIMQAILKIKFCCESMVSIGNLIPCLLNVFSFRPDLAEICAENLNSLFSFDISEMVMFVQRLNLLGKIVDILGLRFDNIEPKVNTAAVRAHIASALQSMSGDRYIGKEIKIELDKYPLWKEFKHQKHDLFIEEPSIVSKMLGSSGVAGYLQAAHNSQKTAFNQEHHLLLTQNTPPPLIFENSDDED